ncbi:hypothetical protein M378DRAFT_847658 [Amanita muscaria Koide BX008]|uniref:Uncharacterized protein n=1 Tax=Amanita muscaria (strain Koide BX008) TaxID=946122 RepID=A0A0C2T520_AMAMK|nr:hypothetical protein M378DRAFT_847658 [Amanita muscaria Koide BX008]
MIFAHFLTTLVLATAAFAVPQSLLRIPWGLSSHITRLMQLQYVKVPDTSLASKVSHVQYSTNWAGAIWESYPTGTFNKVVGTFTVPTLNGPDGSAMAWIGIDGSTCRSAILRTGIAFNLQNGVASYDAWYGWFPEYSRSFGNAISINAGDIIKLAVTASSTTDGIALIENMSNGQSVSKHLSSPSYPLCQQNAEWIVEDFESGGSLSSFCNFGTVNFIDAYAYTNDGQTLSPSGATELGITSSQNGQALTSVHVDYGRVSINRGELGLFPRLLELVMSVVTNIYYGSGAIISIIQLVQLRRIR